MNDYDDAASQYVFSDVCHRSKDSYCVLLQQFHIDVTLHSCERQHIIRLSEEESSAIRNGMFFFRISMACVFMLGLLHSSMK